MERWWRLSLLTAFTLGLSTNAMPRNIKNLIQSVELDDSVESFSLTASRKGRPLKNYSQTAQYEGRLIIPDSLEVVRGNIKGLLEVKIQFAHELDCIYRSGMKDFLQGIFRKNTKNNRLSFDYCSDGSKSGDMVYVDGQVKISLDVSRFSNREIAIKAVFKKPVEQPQEGLLFPSLTPQEGQFLYYNGSAWVLKDYVKEGIGLGEVLSWDGSNWVSTSPEDISFVGQPGPQGVQGEMGPQGPQGEIGPQGPAGVAGADGAQGPQGEVGAQGPQGEVGPQGPAGVAGADGAQGPQGPQGEIGPMGPQGPQGEVGPQGPAGVAGADGAQGPQGETGPQGPQGEQGAQGPMGPMGPEGAQGPQGEPGSDAEVQLIAGAGIVGNNIVNNSTIAVNVGTAAGQIPQLDENGKLPSSVIPENEENSSGGSISVALIQDVKASGTNGGYCYIDVWNERTLNTVAVSQGFVNLAGNAIQLEAGKYYIEIQAPSYYAGVHQARLVDTSNAPILFGSVAHSHPTAGSMTFSTVQGELNLSSPGSFKVQHRCGVDRSTVGLGVAAGFGSPEVYTQVKITKID